MLQRRIAVRPVHCILRRSLLRCRVADNTPCHVVEADGRRCDQFDGRSFEQGGVAPGAGTDDQGVGIPDIGRCDGFPGEVFHPGIRFEYSFQKGMALSATIFTTVFELVNCGAKIVQGEGGAKFI